MQALCGNPHKAAPAMIGCARRDPSRAFPSTTGENLCAQLGELAKGERILNSGGLTEPYFPGTHPQVTAERWRWTVAKKCSRPRER